MQCGFEMLLIVDEDKIIKLRGRYARHSTDLHGFIADNARADDLCDLACGPSHGNCFIRLYAEREVWAVGAGAGELKALAGVHIFGAAEGVP